MDDCYEEYIKLNNSEPTLEIGRVFIWLQAN